MLLRPKLSLESLEDRCVMSADVVLEWNQVLLDTFKAERGPGMVFGRPAAIVHAAIYDAVNAIDRSHTPFFAHVKAPRGASLEAAAAQAAHDTMAELFPTHKATFDATLDADLADIPRGTARLGVAVGKAVAQQILDWRRTDGWDRQVNYTPGTGPGAWQPTSSSPPQGPQWGSVTPFCIPSDDAFRPPRQPDLDSDEYTAAFDEVKSLGAANSTTRTAEQSEIARFWYGTSGTFTAAGYWNQIAEGVSQRRGDSLVQNARLFALLNLSIADAQFAVWDTKYTYNFWRPVTAIRAADTDGNDDTVADTTWTPFLNTPNHPSYSSGHSGLSGASVAVLTASFGDVGFSLSTDSLPGVTRSYASFSAALQECSDSRVYAGIHWRFDVQVGQATGLTVGDYVLTHFLLPASPPEEETGGAVGAAAFAAVGGYDPSLLALAAGGLVNNQAQIGAGRGGALDHGSTATATVVTPTSSDNPATGGATFVASGGAVCADLHAVLAADLASTDQVDVFGDLGRL